MDEIELDRQKALQGWDRQSRAEWEAYLDEMEVQEPAETPCTCYYVDVDLVENRYCEAHGPRF